MAFLKRFVLAIGLGALTALLVWWVARPRHGDLDQPALAPANSTEPAARSEVALRPAPERAAADLPASAPAATPPTERPIEDQADVDAPAAPPLPPGMIDVAVLLDTQPIAGASVKIWPYELGRTFQFPMEPARDRRERSTDAQGLARFEQVDAGEWAVAARVPPDCEAQTRVSLPRDGPGARATIVFGSGGVQGHVWDEQGAPRGGSRIQVSPAFSVPRVSCAVRPDGSYRIAGLVEGSYWISEKLEDDARSQPERSVRFELGAGEWKTIDFGSALRRARWTGTVRRSDGSPAAGPGVLSLEEVHSHVHSTLSYGASAAFEHELAPGSYALRAWLWSGQYEFGKIEMGEVDLQRDVTLPGAELCGTITYRGAWHDKHEPAVDAQVWLRHAGDAGGAGETRVATRRVDDQYGFQGLLPGDYVLSCHPQRIDGAAGGELAVSVPAGSARVQVDFDITDP